jgi:hypothetical protein
VTQKEHLQHAVVRLFFQSFKNPPSERIHFFISPGKKQDHKYHPLTVLFLKLKLTAKGINEGRKILN